MFNYDTESRREAFLREGNSIVNGAFQRSQKILVTMRCPRCDSKVYPVEDSRFVWIQCGVCGKKSLAIEKEGMWGDETN